MCYTFGMNSTSIFFCVRVRCPAFLSWQLEGSRRRLSQWPAPRVKPHDSTGARVKLRPPKLSSGLLKNPPKDPTVESLHPGFDSKVRKRVACARGFLTEIACPKMPSNGHRQRISRKRELEGSPV